MKNLGFITFILLLFSCRSTTFNEIDFIYDSAFVLAFENEQIHLNSNIVDTANIVKEVLTKNGFKNILENNSKFTYSSTEENTKCRKANKSIAEKRQYFYQSNDKVSYDSIAYDDIFKQHNVSSLCTRLTAIESKKEIKTIVATFSRSNDLGSVFTFTLQPQTDNSTLIHIIGQPISPVSTNGLPCPTCKIDYKYWNLVSGKEEAEKITYLLDELHEYSNVFETERKYIKSELLEFSSKSFLNKVDINTFNTLVMQKFTEITSKNNIIAYNDHLFLRELLLNYTQKFNTHLSQIEEARKVEMAKVEKKRKNAIAKEVRHKKQLYRNMFIEQKLKLSVKESTCKQIIGRPRINENKSQFETKKEHIARTKRELEESYEGILTKDYLISDEMFDKKVYNLETQTWSFYPSIVSYGITINGSTFSPMPITKRFIYNKRESTYIGKSGFGVLSTIRKEEWEECSFKSQMISEKPLQLKMVKEKSKKINNKLRYSAFFNIKLNHFDYQQKDAKFIKGLKGQSDRVVSYDIEFKDPTISSPTDFYSKEYTISIDVNAIIIHTDNEVLDVMLIGND